MDQGSMMRYLSEMIWFPTALLGDKISFEPINDETARVPLPGLFVPSRLACRD
jgi:hypothetical protein